MRKLWILIISIIFILAGCGANTYGVDNTVSAVDSTANGETTIMTTITTIATTAITKAAGKPEQANRTEDVTKKMEDKIIEINVETQRGEGTLTFKVAKLISKYNRVVFYFTTSEEKILLANPKETFLLGKSGAKYPFAGGGQLMETIYGCNQDMAFEEITDFSDLSTVTLTYAFEGYDPVTVTFDIPGL